MTTQELRIGNLVNTPNPNMNPFKIEHIEAVGIDKVGGSNGIGSFSIGVSQTLNRLN